MTRGSPHPQRGHELIARFLGPEAAAGGPFALLGIDPAMCTPSAVDAGWQRQLDRLAQHPEGDTAEADQVRLALDAAASELLDPISRAAWLDELRRAREPRTRDEAPAEVNAATVRNERAIADSAAAQEREPSEVSPLFMRLLIRLAVGLGLSVLALGLGLWVMRNPAPNTSARTPSVVSVETPAAAPEPAATAADARAAAGAEKPAPQPVPPPLAPLRVRGRSEFSDGPTLIRELRAAVSEAASDPGRGLARFEHVNAVAADWWCRYDAVQLRAAADAVVELLYRVAAHPDHAARLMSVLTEPMRVLEGSDGEAVHAVNADEVWPAAWSAGVVARCARERELPPAVVASLGSSVMKLSSAGSPLGEQSFDAGTRAAFAALPRAIIAGGTPAGPQAEAARGTALDAMKRWVEGVTLATAAAPDQRERFLVEALGWLLKEPGEPDADPRVFDAVTYIASELKWKAGPAGGGARGKLIDWFRDPRVSSADLRVLTSAIATKSGAEAVDATMVLSMSAQSDDRPRLRDRYAAAWSLAEASTRADSAREWVVKAQELIEATPKDDELAQLASAANLAEQNWRAMKIWRGDSTSPDDPGGLRPDPAAIAASPMPAGTAPPAPLPPGSVVINTTIGSVTGEARDGAWAENFLRAERNIPIRLERIAEIEQVGPPIGWIDAAVLAETACFGSPSQVRGAAQRAISRFADEPAMVSAMLDYLPVAPRIRSVSDVYARLGLQSLPRPADAGWEVAARRALVERLLSMIADDGVHGQIEHLALRIAACYLDAAEEPTPAATADAAAIGAVRGAGLLLTRARHEASSLPIAPATKFNLPAIDRRAEQRRAQAIGPVQSFSAEQVALAEVFGALVAAERPERESAVTEVLDELAAQRRKAKHVFAQIWAAERAIARLWLLRLNTEEEGTAS